MIPLPSLTDSAAALGLSVLGVALVVVGTWLGRWTAPEPNPVTETDTVRVGRTITKRDTVTETVPKVVRTYDTVRTTDTVRVPVPESFDYLGSIERRPVDVQGDEVTLTYFRDGRYMQNEYNLPQDRWGVGLQSDFTFAKWVQGTLTADVMRHAEWGPLDVRTRFGVGYGALVTDGTAQVSPVARAGFRIGYDW
ncbi:hypothetical protein GGP77_001632 [Salinibacter ruber]|uniref:hypothetical protein n=1 Tax=Salinibacter ruber TaxID=146919 RepID=UPI002168A6C7|nr:hypothetical protein [Salinibacter ruber]MCS3667403.1 hypothetical protein [Salinibacter ruber]